MIFFFFVYLSLSIAAGFFVKLFQQRVSGEIFDEEPFWQGKSSMNVLQIFSLVLFQFY